MTGGNKTKPIHFTAPQIHAVLDLVNHVLGGDALAGDLAHLRTGVLDRVYAKCIKALPYEYPCCKAPEGTTTA